MKNLKKKNYVAPRIETILFHTGTDCLRESMDNFVETPGDWAIWDKRSDRGGKEN